MKKYIGEIGLVLVAIIWGSGFVGTQLCLDGGLLPLQIITIRFFISAAILSMVFFKTIKDNINKETIKAGALLGVILFLAFATQTIGLKFTTPSKNAFITATNVVIVPFIGYLIYKRKLDKIGMISSVITLIGIGILSLEADFSINVGDILTLICAIGFALHIFLTSELAPKHNPLVLTTIQFAIASALSFIVQISVGQGVISADASGYIGVLYLALFSTIIGFVTQTICQKKVDSTKTAIILSTEAIFGTIFSIILLNEPLTLKLIVGSILIFVSIIAAETKLSFIKNKAKAINKIDEKMV